MSQKEIRIIENGRVRIVQSPCEGCVSFKVSIFEGKCLSCKNYDKYEEEQSK